MNEQHKLTEALYFLSHLGPSSLDPQEYSFELSAFLTAARSVLQYARKEAITKPGGQEWYDKHVQNEAIEYFKDKRDVSIHTEPVVPNQQISVVVALTVPPVPNIAVNLKVTDRDGNVIDERNITSQTSQAREPKPPPSPSVTVFYRFNDWSGAEDVEALCQQYFAAIKAVVIDGQAKSFLSV